MYFIHKPVLLNEVINYLNPAPNKNFIDCTLGAGGHSRAILDKIKPNGKVLAIDQDIKALKHWNPGVLERGRVVLANDNFKNLQKIVEKNFPYPVHGILLDLGLLSDQLENSGRGFSFQKDEPLDMRFDTRQSLTAAEILNSYSLEKLKYIFKNYGELRQAQSFAERIVEVRKKLKKEIKKYRNKNVYVCLKNRPLLSFPSRIKVRDKLQRESRIQYLKHFHLDPRFRGDDKAGKRESHRNKEIQKPSDSYISEIKTTYDLLNVLNLKSGVQFSKGKRLKNPAYQVFQALRIAVNDELTNLVQVLPQAVQILEPGGRLVVISFHSLEDRIVKNFFRDEARLENPRLRVLTKKPITSSLQEVKQNPRSRSAKLRCVEKN